MATRVGLVSEASPAPPAQPSPPFAQAAREHHRDRTPPRRPSADRAIPHAHPDPLDHPTGRRNRHPSSAAAQRTRREPEGHLSPSRHDPSSAVPDDSVENPVEESPKTWERPSPNHSERAVYQGFRWWRGQDLNLRPSGYEPDELPDCSTPRRGGHDTGRCPNRQTALLCPQSHGWRLCPNVWCSVAPGRLLWLSTGCAGLRPLGRCGPGPRPARGPRPPG